MQDAQYITLCTMCCITSIFSCNLVLTDGTACWMSGGWKYDGKERRWEEWRTEEWRAERIDNAASTQRYNQTSKSVYREIIKSSVKDDGKEEGA